MIKIYFLCYYNLYINCGNKITKLTKILKSTIINTKKSKVSKFEYYLNLSNDVNNKDKNNNLSIIKKFIYKILSKLLLKGSNFNIIKNLIFNINNYDKI